MLWLQDNIEPDNVQIFLPKQLLNPASNITYAIVGGPDRIVPLVVKLGAPSDTEPKTTSYPIVKRC